MRIAIISDIHANVAALEAVFHDIKRRGVDHIVNLGDSVSGPLWPRETLTLLSEMNVAASIRGNHDRAVAEPGAMHVGESDRYALSVLDAASCSALGQLPATLWVTPGILACHGTPNSDTDYMLETVHDGTLVLASVADLMQRLDGCRAQVVLCGHSHQPRVVSLGSETIIVNPGSVGNPAYRSGSKDHVSEAGSPHARYAILEMRYCNAIAFPSVQLLAVDYDCEAAARQALANGRRDWAGALKSGFVSNYSEP